MQDVSTSPELIARGFFRTLPHQAIGRTSDPGTPMGRFAVADGGCDGGAVPRAAHARGAREVLGLGADEIDDLDAAGLLR